MRAIRQEIKRREQLGENWRDVLNEMRPHTKKSGCNRQLLSAKDLCTASDRGGIFTAIDWRPRPQRG
jgi:hypothetical protein